MADTTFVNRSTVITADWLNDVNDFVYNTNTLGVTYNVKGAPYNADGDGTDDSTAIQAAIDAASTAGGGTVYFPKGTYGIGTTITVPSNIRLLGEGKGVSVIKALSSLAITAQMIKNESGDTGFDVFADHDITLEHLTFDGSGRTYPAYDQNTNPPTYGGLSQANSRGHLVRMYSVERFASFFCEYTNHPSIAPLVLAGGRDNKVIGNWFHDNGKIDDVSPCLFVSPSFPNSTPNYNCIVTNNHFYNCDRMAARFEVDGGTFSHNIMDDLGEGGIHVKKTRFCSIIGNTFRNFRVTDIVANAIEMEFEDEDEDGLVTISGNLIEEIGTTGIALNGAQQVVVTGNIFRNCGTAAVYPTPNGPLNYEAGRSAGDTINTTKRCAIQLTSADTYHVRNAVIKDNVIVDTDGVMQYGIVFAVTGTPLEQFENVLIKDNIIVGAVTSKYYLPTTASVGSNVIIDELVDTSNKQLGLNLDLNAGYSVAGSPTLTVFGTNNGRVLALDAASTESWQWTLAPNINKPAGSYLAGLRIYGQKAASAGTGNIVLEIATEPRVVSTGNIGGGTFETQSFTQAVSADGSSVIEQFDLILTTAVEWTSGTFLLLKLSRLGASGSDTWGNDYYIVAVQPIFK